MKLFIVAFLLLIVVACAPAEAPEAQVEEPVIPEVEPETPELPTEVAPVEPTPPPQPTTIPEPDYLEFVSSVVEVEFGETKIVPYDLTNRFDARFPYSIRFEDVNNKCVFERSTSPKTSCPAIYWSTDEDFLEPNEKARLTFRVTSSLTKESYTLRLIVWDEVKNEEHDSGMFTVKVI